MNTKILFLTSVDHPQVRLEAEALRQMYNVNYVSIKFEGWKKELKSLFNNIPTLFIILIKLKIPPVPSRLFLYNLLLLGSILDKIKHEDQNYDLIYAHWLFPAGFIGLALSKIIGCKTISVIWGYDIQVVSGVKSHTQGLNRIIPKFVMERSDLVIVNHLFHKRLAEDLLGRVSDKILYVTPAIPDISINVQSKLTDELRERLDIEAPNEKTLVLYSPSLRLGYGIIEFVKAISMINKKDNFVFIIAGEGELKDEAIKFVKNNGLKNVIFVGKVSHESMKVLYKLSTVVCDLAYPGTGTTTLEAFCFGKPVIGIRSPKTIIKHGVNGFAISKGDHEALARYIITISEDHELRKKLSLNARRTFEEAFSIQKRINRILEVFNSVI
jgi:glycosyltransferase involved in cell wall biosynthesis